MTGYDTRTDLALLYRLNGDRNPLHSDPAFAAMAGFDTPILHGLCTFGVTGRALLHTLCDSDPARFGSMGGRFKAPVLPGQRLDVCMWVDGRHHAVPDPGGRPGSVRRRRVHHPLSPWLPELPAVLGRIR